MVATRLDVRCGILVAGVAALLGLFSVPAPASAQDDGKRSARDGVYTAEQAERGEVTFTTFCGSCHSSQEFHSRDFQSRVGGEEIFWLFDFIRYNMPKYEEGSLPRQMYLDVLAYFLKLQGNPPGDAELPSTEEGLMGILFPVYADGPPR